MNYATRSFFGKIYIVAIIFYLSNILHGLNWFGFVGYEKGTNICYAMHGFNVDCASILETSVLLLIDHSVYTISLFFSYSLFLWLKK